MDENVLLLILCMRYLEVDEQLQEVSGRHDDGGVERDDVALVQTQVQVGGQPLRHDTSKQSCVFIWDIACVKT